MYTKHLPFFRALQNKQQRFSAILNCDFPTTKKARGTVYIHTIPMIYKQKKKFYVVS